MSEQDVNNVLQPKPEIRPPESFSPEEIQDVIEIVDVGLQHAEDIEPENITGVLMRGVVLLEEERKRNSSVLSDMPLGSALRKIGEGFSMTHAIQCPVNSRVDFAIFEDRFHRFMKDNGIAPDTKDAGFIQSFLDSHKEMNTLLIDLYVVDIARRYDIAKRDPRFFDNEWPKLKRLLPKISAQLVRFSNENSQKIQAADPELRQKIEENKANMSLVIANPDKAELHNSLYDTVIKPFSRITFYHFEGLNESLLRQSVRNLESSATS